jgi:hypothetical protein
MADLVELENALESERSEMLLIQRVNEIDLKEEEMFPSTAGEHDAMSPGSATSPMSPDTFSTTMSTVGLAHTNREGHQVFLKADQLPEELDLFHFCADTVAADIPSSVGYGTTAS